jgi:hypothetical protein
VTTTEQPLSTKKPVTPQDLGTAMTGGKEDAS